jgi:hypothetical protein
VIDTVPAFSGSNPDDTSSFWSVQAGIEKKFIPLGKTTVYGEYYDYSGGAIARTVGAGDALNTISPAPAAAQIWSSDVQVYGLGFAQGIDAAAMVLYVSYRHVEGDLTLVENGTNNLSKASFEDLDLVNAGAIIKF